MKEMKPCCNVRWAVLGSVAAVIADCRADVCGFITGSVADCHSDGISIDVGDAVSQTVTALRFATIVLALIAAIMLMIMNLNHG